MALWNPFRKKETPAAETLAQPDASGQPERQPDEPPGDSATHELPAPTALPSAAPASTSQKVGFFGSLRSALQNTIKFFNTDIRDLVKDGRLVDDEFLDELFLYLVKTDMGNRSAAQIRDDIHRKFRGRKVHLQDLVQSAKESIRQIMRQESNGLRMADTGPTVIMVVGVNGSGKTTSIAKLTYRFVQAGKTVVLGAGDTFRAAAVEQLTIWAQRLGAQIVTGKPGSDPASVAYKATEAAKNQNADICIIDTAGRLQTQTNLMDELSRVKKVIGKVIPEAPHEVLLVLDATAGQNAISQAKGFSQAADCTGIVLAKLDGTAKGGVAIPIRQEFDLPVKFIGLGETPDALAEFDVDTYVDALFDSDR